MAQRSFVACFLIASFFICCNEASYSCDKSKCQVLVERGSSSDFRFKASEEGVRLVYVHFKIFNDSYEPLASKNRILPYRWVWSRSVSESMLALSYDYDVLSLGLLKNQVRTVMVSLKEIQHGCLADLNSSCQDIAIAEALVSMTTNLTTTQLTNEINPNVVCFRVLQEFSFGVGGGFKYQCCKKAEGDRAGKREQIYCGFDVKESKWLSIFNGILNIVVSIVFLYWPLLFCAIPDYFFNGHRKKREENEFQMHPQSFSKHEKTCNEEEGEEMLSTFNEIPVDDSSPITFAMIVQKFAESLPLLDHGFNVKLFFLLYCAIPIFFYVKLGLYFIIKGNFDDASRKLLFQFGDFYLYIFSMDKPAVHVLFIVPLFAIPTLMISCWRPEAETLQSAGKCCICGREMRLTPQKEILKHMRVMPSSVKYVMGKVLDKLCRRHFQYKFLRDTEPIHFHDSLCGHAICVLRSVLYVVIVVPVALIVIPLVALLVSVVSTVLFSPFICLMQIIFRFIRKRLKYGSLLILILLYSSISVSIVAIFSCQFVVRMFGFVVMGITLNAEFAVPYVTFAFVVWRNIYLCYSNLQNTYKEIKTMISEQWKEQKKPCREDTIPTELFWFVCEGPPNVLPNLVPKVSRERPWERGGVLPIANEICAMLCNVVAILIFLCVALAAIFLFKVAYNSSAIVSTVAVFVSGKISEMFFNRFTTGCNINGWERVRKKHMIRLAVEKFIQTRVASQTHVVSLYTLDESDSSNVYHQTTV